MSKKVLLTGDRPTGPLHLGHYKGSLENRLVLQDKYNSFIMIADAQALTDHSDQSKQIADNVYELVLDYLSVGIDPDKVTIFIESMIPAIPELAQYFLNLVSLNRLHHNPTVKNEMKQKGYEVSVPAGFIAYPIFQAADITCVGATIVPVGADQKPMLEQTNEIIRKWTQSYGPVFEEVEGVYSKFSRLPGIDGKAKMSKTLNNAIYLKDDPKSVEKKVKKMFTDPNHLHIEDPGCIEGNTVFTYLDAFGQEKHAEEIQELKEHYQRGGLGDGTVKKRLIEILEEFYEPIRKRRALYEKDRSILKDILVQGTKRAQEASAIVLEKVKTSMGLNYF